MIIFKVSELMLMVLTLLWNQPKDIVLINQP